MWKKRILVALGASAAIMCSTHATVACETALPADISVTPPPADLPAEFKQFVGAFGNGEWDGQLCHALIVRTVDQEGNAQVIYSVGTYSGWNIWKSCSEGVGKIANGKLVLRLARAEATYTPNAGGLEGVYRITTGGRTGSTYKATLTRGEVRPGTATCKRP